MKIYQQFIFCSLLLLLFVGSIYAKSWRGIEPLKSTRSDVIKLLGNPTHLQWNYRDYFILENETVTFSWIDPTCAKKFPVQPDSEITSDDLVLSISVAQKTPIQLKELQLNDSVVYFADCFGGGCTFIDDKSGFMYHESKGEVTSHSYYPTNEEFKTWKEGHSTCQSSR